jgi:hypothetical protein
MGQFLGSPVYNIDPSQVEHFDHMLQKRRLFASSF